MKQTKISKHAYVDHSDRVVFIATEIGFGEEIDEIQIYDVERGYRRVSLRTTGVAILKAPTEEFVITMYCPKPSQIAAWYGGKNFVPVRLWNVAKRNEKKGWTSLE